MRPALLAFALPLAMSLLASGAPAQNDDLHVTADHAEATGPDAQGNPSLIIADGHVRARRGALVVRGQHLSVDRARNEALLEGNVCGLDGLVVFTARKLVYDNLQRSVALTDGQMAVKTGTTPVQLYGIFNSDHPDALWTVGRNAFVLKADRLTREDPHHIVARHGYFTSCSCPEGCRPLLSFTATKVVVDPGETADMTWPIFRLFKIPFFALPWFQVPLSSRRSGLLFPTITTSGPGGVDLTLPYYITLGRSADLTLSLDWFGGTSNASVGGNSINSLGVRGFGDEVELRWRPAQEAIGSLHVFHVYDTSNTTPGHGDRGNRGSVELTHAQALLGGRLGVNVDAVSDSDVLLDTALPLPQRNVPYLRSWAEFSRSLGATSLSLETNGIQDLRPGPLPCPANTACGTEFSRTPATQLPAVAAPVARMVMGQIWPTGRLTNDLELTASLEDALPWEHFLTGAAPVGLEPFGGSHTSRFISDLHWVQTLPLLSGRYGGVTLSGSERAQFLTDLNPSQPGWRSGGYLDLLARTRIARTFASGIVHEIVPSLQVRGIGVVQGIGHSDATPFSGGLFPSVSRPQLLQSDLDMALPRDGTVQAIARLATAVYAPGKPLFAMALEYHVALYPFDAGQLHPTIDFWALGFHWNLNSGMDLTQKQFTSAGATISRAVGTSTVSASAQYLDGGSDDQIARGLDVLFTPRSEIPPPGLVAQQLVFGVATNLALGPVRLISALTLSKTLGPQGTLAQDYLVEVLYEAQSCGKLSLALHWVHQLGQPYQAPIPTPNFAFDNPGGVASAAQAAAVTPGY